MASKRASQLFVMVVALLAISTVGHTNLSTDEGGGGGGDHEHKEVKEEKAAAESKEAASESWAGWAQEKLSEGLGMKRDESKSSDSKETAAEKKKQTETDDHEEEVSWAKEKTKEVYDKAKNKAGETLEAAKHKSHGDEVKDNVAPARGDQVLEEL